MRKILKLSFLSIFFGLFWQFFSMPVIAQGINNQILDRMNAHHQALQSLEASIRMDKYNAQLDETDTTEGTVKYLPKHNKATKGKMYVRLDWLKPVVEQISVIGDDYVLYRPRLNQVYVGKTNSARNNAKAGNALAFMSMSKAELNANYTVKYLGVQKVAGGIETWHLELTPKNPTSYKTAYLWVDGNGMPIMAKVIENNNDSTTVLLSNLRKNITIAGSDFQIKYPKNIKPIRG
jgi:outer membrane lipoprotein-sorting protein